ncbi:unnamed protein product [Cyclocybe aegerita]|uniref:DUF1793-domain-containing protein n=1 Tax=Cyclocybe aegerita TaxID=1973307 RepID=A0A8S0WV36_CYCAE|nr:unnamed protein product [Cyclocybe aegerita]
MVRVDGEGYQWHGVEPEFPTINTTAIYLTATRTILTFEAGPIRFNVTYLSPVEPSDWVRQSFPFSYISIDAVWSTDGQRHGVQFYFDTSGQWLSADDQDTVKWNTTSSATSLIHSMQLSVPQAFQEGQGVAKDSNLYLAISQESPGLTWETNWAQALRRQFDNNGSLTNTQDTASRPINANQPALAASVDLGSIQQASPSVVWAIGLVRQPTIQFQTPRDNDPQQHHSFFWTKYTSIDEAIDDFILDFPNALTRSVTLDRKVMEDAGKVSSQYADLAALSVRQMFAALDITVPELTLTVGASVTTTAAGAAATGMAKIRVFMKDTGTTRQTNPVETIYGSLPGILYFNASLAGALLLPLLEYGTARKGVQNSPSYASMDLGSSYPDATGPSRDQSMYGADTTSSMLIMVLAHAKKSGDGSLIQNHLPLLLDWADYLYEAPFANRSILLTSDTMGVFDSNTALKCIHALYAMSEILGLDRSASPDIASRQQYYSDRATLLLNEWRNSSFLSDHVTSTPGVETSWGLVHNMYASKLLNVSLVDKGTINAQTSFYASRAASVGPFGFPYTSNSPITRSDWSLFTAASVTSDSVRDEMISKVHAYAFLNRTECPWPTIYDSNSGVASLGCASPGQGAMFALLAPEIPDQVVNLILPTSTSNPLIPGASAEENSFGTAKIVGTTIGGLAFVLLIVGLAFLIRRGRSRSTATATQEAMPFTFDGEKLVKSSKTASVPAEILLTSNHYPARSTSELSSAPPTMSDVPRSEDTIQLRRQFEEIQRELAAIREVQAMQQMQIELPPTYEPAVRARE